MATENCPQTVHKLAQNCPYTSVAHGLRMARSPKSTPMDHRTHASDNTTNTAGSVTPRPSVGCQSAMPSTHSLISARWTSRRLSGLALGAGTYLQRVSAIEHKSSTKRPQHEHKTSTNQGTKQAQTTHKTPPEPPQNPKYHL